MMLLAASFIGQRTSLMLLLLLLVAVLVADSFTAVSLPTTIAPSRLHSSVAWQGEEESEWYCPPTPPPSAETVPRIPAGQMALQTEITTAQELEALLHDGDERLTIVKFYASWCKSCAKFSRKLDQYAIQHADWVDKNYYVNGVNNIRHRGDVRIVHVEYGASRELCKALEVKRLPTVHMYQGGQKVQDFCCPPPKFHRVNELTDYYLRRQSRNQREQMFENTLDKGRELIQGKLDQEREMAKGLQAAAETVYAKAAAAAAAAEPAPAKRQRRFWQRFRNRRVTE